MSGDISHLLVGARYTLAISLIATAFGMVLGILAALLARSNKARLRALASFYVSFIRGTPLLVQILAIFYILPDVGIDLPALVAGVIALAINSSAYICEMLRGAMNSIPRGQFEAADALALPRWRTWLHVVLPQVIRLVIPPLTVEFSALIKGSALLSVIGIVELTRAGQQVISSTFDPITTWLEVAAVYFVLCFSLGMLTRYLQRSVLGGAH